MNPSSLKKIWLSNIRGDVLAGLVVALALIPEAIAFSIIAGVDPKVGLYASFSMAVVIAFAGGRPGMISAATGAMALVMVTLVKDHGLQYLLVATLLTGVLQIGAGLLKDALKRFLQAQSIIAARALVVHAKDDQAVEFYRHFGFVPSPLDRYHLYLMTKDVQECLA